jgi:hypothetical protein
MHRIVLLGWRFQPVISRKAVVDSRDTRLDLLVVNCADVDGYELMMRHFDAWSM